MQSLVSNHQTTCSYCEELVHRYATRCPYCQHALSAPKASLAEIQALSALISLKDDPHLQPTSEKITHLPKPEFKAQAPAAPLSEPAFKPLSVQAISADILLPKQPQENEDTAAEQSYSLHLLKVLLPLIALLAGSFFFFFGLLLKLFSKNGKLVLEWSADSWPYYVFPALVLLVVGLFSLSQVEPETPEI